MTGGYDGTYLVYSTEIYVLLAWSYASSLPSPYLLPIDVRFLIIYRCGKDEDNF